MDSSAAVEAQLTPAQSVIELENRHVLQNYVRYPLVFKRGRGCWVYDIAGKRYLDLIAGIGVNAMGHAHPRILRAIREQAAQMIHCSNLYYHEYQGRLAQKIAETSGLDRVFFCNSGTEAMEAALKMARAYGKTSHVDKFEIVALENSFHGRTMGAVSITGQPKYRKDFEPLIPGVNFVPVQDTAALEAAVSERTCAIVLEVIQGEGGIYPICDRMLRKARELADRVDALLIFDEVQCGVGRPGVHYAYQLFDPVIVPDVMVAAKPVSCGLPLGFLAATERAAKAIGAGMHGTTFGGGPLTCRVALEFYEMLDELLPEIREKGEYFRTKLEELAARLEFVEEIRVRGLMIGIDLKMPGKQFVTDAMKEGLLINCTHDTVIRFLPPYIITKQEIDRAMRTLAKIFRNGAKYYEEHLATAVPSGTA
jgi:acetylornithine/N-succinyldiaminopimelate aminotransferase